MKDIYKRKRSFRMKNDVKISSFLYDLPILIEHGDKCRAAAKTIGARNFAGC